MGWDVLTAIKFYQNALTRVESQIADYVTKHAYDVTQMPITQLALRCGVGESTVFRFCRHIGCAGYQDFRMGLAVALRQAERKPDRADCLISAEDSDESLIHKVYNNSLAILHETHEMLRANQLTLALERLFDAERILFVGVDSSLAAAMDSYHRFLQVTPKVCASMDVRTQALLATMLTPRDVLIAFCHSGSDTETLSMAERAKQKGAFVIGITCLANSALYQMSDLSFLCGYSDGPYQSGKMTAKIAYTFITEMLCVSYRIRSALSPAGEPAALLSPADHAFET